MADERMKTGFEEGAMELFRDKKSIALYVIVIIVFSGSYADASANIFPTDGWQITTPEAQGMQSQKLAEMMEHIQKNSFTIDSITIVRNGYMVLDAYFYPFLKGQKHHIFSCTKSIMSALIGIAIGKGFIKHVNQPIMEFFQDKAFANADNLKKSITLENLLMMASGLKCRDSYLYRWRGYFEMRYSDDWAQFGWLYLNQGHWGNRQIIPSAWIEASTRAHISATLFDDYGYQWWVDSGGYFMAVGHRGQRIFIVPEKNLVAVFTGDLRDSRLALILKNLLDFYIIPAASLSNALPINRPEQARLDTLVNRVAKRKAYSWISEKEGMAEDGVFKRTASPAFKFEYPPGSKKETIRYPNQIMRMRTLGDVLFSAYVLDIPKGMKPEDFGPKFYARDLENYGSNIKVNSNQEITLDCGTKAYQTEITWLWGSKIWMTDFIVSAYRDDQVVYLLTETWKHHDKLEPIVQSLTFK
jgi:hypothetical protein